MSYSLQRKLASGLLISLISAFILIWLLINSSVRYLTHDYVYTRLAHDAETLLAVIVKNPDQFDTKITDIGAIYQQPFSGHYYEVIKDKQIIRSRSLWDQNLNYPSNLSSQETRLEGIGPMGQPLLLLAGQFTKSGQKITIIIAEDMSSVENALKTFRTSFTLVVVVILIILIILQIKGLRKGLLPLKQLQSDLNSLEMGKITSIKTEVPAELTPLVIEINHLHKVLADKISRHRNALSDLAHALKKPLTVLQQLSKDKNIENLPEIKNILVRQVETTQQLTQRILNRARLAGSAQSGTVFNFDTDLSGLIDTLNMMYRDKNLTMRVTLGSELQSPFDREDMLELLGNILDNACKWADKNISIDVHVNATLCIIIEDDGPGIPLQNIQLITKRGIRLDETVAGHGLGLGIVNDIIEHYSGSAVYDISQKLGGLKVTLELPI